MKSMKNILNKENKQHALIALIVLIFLIFGIFIGMIAAQKTTNTKSKAAEQTQNKDINISEDNIIITSSPEAPGQEESIINANDSFAVDQNNEADSSHIDNGENQQNQSSIPLQQQPILAIGGSNTAQRGKTYVAEIIATQLDSPDAYEIAISEDTYDKGMGLIKGNKNSNSIRAYFSWNLTYIRAGNYPVKLVLNDLNGEEIVNATTTITVLDNTDPIVYFEIYDMRDTAYAGEPFEVGLSARFINIDPANIGIEIETYQDVKDVRGSNNDIQFYNQDWIEWGNKYFTNLYWTPDSSLAGKSVKRKVRLVDKTTNQVLAVDFTYLHIINKSTADNIPTVEFMLNDLNRRVYSGRLFTVPIIVKGMSQPDDYELRITNITPDTGDNTAKFDGNNWESPPDSAEQKYFRILNWTPNDTNADSQYSITVGLFDKNKQKFIVYASADVNVLPAVQTSAAPAISSAPAGKGECYCNISGALGLRIDESTLTDKSVPLYTCVAPQSNRVYPFCVSNKSACNAQTCIVNFSPSLKKEFSKCLDFVDPTKYFKRLSDDVMLPFLKVNSVIFKEKSNCKNEDSSDRVPYYVQECTIPQGCPQFSQ